MSPLPDTHTRSEPNADLQMSGGIVFSVYEKIYPAVAAVL
jgi:hypothetical protein